MKRYDNCIRTDGMCGACSLSSRGIDCHNIKINSMLYLRSLAGITQKELETISGVNSRQIQRYEAAASSTENMTLKNAVAIAKALNCEPADLL